MEEKTYVTVDDVMRLWGVKQAKAYVLIHRANEELKSKGFYTVAGKCPKDFFIEKMGLNYKPGVKK